MQRTECYSEAAAGRLELVNASICDERQKEMAIFQDAKPHKLPVLGHAIMQGAERAHRASER